MVSFGFPAHHVLSCCFGVVRAWWVLFVACVTCVIVGNVASVCPTVIIIVERFYVFGVNELSGGDMPPPWLLLLSSAGVVYCISWVSTVSVFASVAAVAFSFPICSVVTTFNFLSASIVISPDLVLALHLLLWLKRHLICCWWYTIDVPGYDQSCTTSNISNSVSTTTTDAEPAPKLEK